MTKNEYLIAQIQRWMRGTKVKSMRALSLKAGLPEGAVKQILNGRSQHPRIDTLESIAGALGCSVADLTGDLEDGSDEETKVNGRNSHQKVASSSKGDDTYPASVIIIDELDVRASAGEGIVHESDSAGHNHEFVVNKWAIPTNVIRGQTQAPAESLKIITVIGDSMTPLFQPGERVMVDVEDKMPSPSGIFALWDGFGQIIKRLEMIPYSNPPIVRLMSANHEYETRELRLDQMTINGRIVGKWTWT